MRIVVMLCALTVLTALPVCAQVIVQAPQRGIVTAVEPNGQFYTTLGSLDQIFPGTTIRIRRDGFVISQVPLIAINRMDSIGQLPKGLLGFRLRAGDIVEVVTNPAPNEVPRTLPAIEPDPDMRDREILFTLLILFGIGDALID